MAHATVTADKVRFLRHVRAAVGFSGSRLAAARRAAGLTQDQLARLLATQQRRVSDWERGVIDPQPAFIPKLTDAVGVDALEFLAVDPSQPSMQDLRLAAGLTMDEVAKCIGISRSQYRSIEIGARRRAPSADVINRLAHLFSVPTVMIRAAVDPAHR